MHAFLWPAPHPPLPTHPHTFSSPLHFTPLHSTSPRIPHNFHVLRAVQSAAVADNKPSSRQNSWWAATAAKLKRHRKKNNTRIYITLSLRNNNDNCNSILFHRITNTIEFTQSKFWKGSQAYMYVKHPYWTILCFYALFKDNKWNIYSRREYLIIFPCVNVHSWIRRMAFHCGYAYAALSRWPTCVP